MGEDFLKKRCIGEDFLKKRCIGEDFLKKRCIGEDKLKTYCCSRYFRSEMAHRILIAVLDQGSYFVFIWKRNYL